MYRYSVDNAVTFSSDDLVLFRESPFASWMERLTIENPAHGISPDAGVQLPASPYKPQNEFAATLRSSGRQLVQVDWDLDERKRRSATVEAMRNGVDFIVDGQLAVGPLAGPVNLLTRTSGFSELGQYLYMPCDTQSDTSIHATFRLCFLADLLHSMQGQLPPQMLAIRNNVQLSPLVVENFIYLYRAVKQRFMLAQRNFRKHRMPDPAESSHCGRWSDCANEVIRQRTVHKPDGPGLNAASKSDVVMATKTETEAQAATDAVLDEGRYGLDSAPQPTSRSWGGGTLAEQARQLSNQAITVSGDVERRGEVAAAQLEPLSFIADFSGSPEPTSEPEFPDKQYAWTVERSNRKNFPSVGSPHPLDSPGFNISAHSRVYRQSESAPSPDNSLDSAPYTLESDNAGSVSRNPSFSDRLNTSESVDT